MSNFGQKAYEAYRGFRRTNEGTDLPKWERVRHTERLAWLTVGEFIEREIETTEKTTVQTS